MREDVLVRRFIVARLAASLAVVEAVSAEAYVELRLAVDAVFFASAAVFRALT